MRVQVLAFRPALDHSTRGGSVSRGGVQLRVNVLKVPPRDEVCWRRIRARAAWRLLYDPKAEDLRYLREFAVLLREPDPDVALAGLERECAARSLPPTLGPRSSWARLRGPDGGELSDTDRGTLGRLARMRGSPIVRNAAKLLGTPTPRAGAGN